MNERELRRALRARAIPGEAAAHERALHVVRAAGAARTPAPPARAVPRALVAAIVAMAALGATLSPAGADVRGWIGDRFASTASPTLGPVPGGGRLLVSSPGGTWVVRGDGGLRRLGAFTAASWSPRGLYVAATRGRRLYAVEPDGTPRWSIARPRPVSRPAWSPGDGYRVAYLEGHDLRVVTGDGAVDRLVASGVAAVTPAWRPGPGHVLSYATPGGEVVTRDVDGRRTLWERRAARVSRLEWTRDGRRLVAVGGARIRVLGARGQPVSDRSLGGAVGAMAVSPSGRSVAVARAGGGLVIVPVSAAGRPRSLLAGLGEFAGLEWSPGGRWLLASWPAADQWVFVRAGGRRVEAFSRIGEQLDPRGRAGAARPAGWCCG